MAKKEALRRYFLIIEQLRWRKLSYAEINDYLKKNSDDKRSGIARRTLQRDISEIKSLFDIEIACDNYHKYFIKEDERERFSHRMLEAFGVFTTMNQAKKIKPYILKPSRRPQGLEYLDTLFQAIREQVVVKFTYSKEWGKNLRRRTGEPLALKEFKDRWYLLARDLDDNKIIKAFGLDRMGELEVTKKRFKISAEQDLESLFQHTYGITNPQGRVPEEVTLSFDVQQGKYIHSLPLHSSQLLEENSEKEYRISLKLHITPELKMELLSYGHKVKVIKPDWLRDEFRDIYRRALQQYEVTSP